MTNTEITTRLGMTPKQFRSLPLYVQDTLVAQQRVMEDLQAKLDMCQGLKPVDRNEAWRMEGVQVDTDAGTYVFPFNRRPGYERASISLRLANRKRLEVTYNSSKAPGAVEIMAGLGGCQISPRAANCFTVRLDD